MNLKLIVILILIVLVIYYYRIARAAKTLRFTPGKVSNFSLKGGISWTQTVKAVNTDPTSIPVMYASIKPVFGLSQIGSASLKEARIIRGGTITEIDFLIQIPYTDLIYLGVETINALQSGKIQFQLEGSVTSVGVNVPINENFNIQI